MVRSSLSFLLLSAALCAQAPVETARPATAEASAPALLPDGMAAQIRDEGIANSQVMRLLRDLTDMGHRLTGSDNYTKACLWAAGEFQAMGLPVGEDHGE